MYHIFNWLHNFPVCNKSGLLVSTIMKLSPNPCVYFMVGL
jgi:hypothetical protein